MGGMVAIAAAIFIAASNVICGLYFILRLVAGALAALMIVIAGIKWIGGGGDPAERKKYQAIIVAAIVGLVFVIIAPDLAKMVVGDPTKFCATFPSTPPTGTTTSIPITTTTLPITTTTLPITTTTII